MAAAHVLVSAQIVLLGMATSQQAQAHKETNRKVSVSNGEVREAAKREKETNICSKQRVSYA